MEEKCLPLEKLETAVRYHNLEVMTEALETAVKSGISPVEIRRALIRGLEYVRLHLMTSDTSIPDFLLSMDSMTEGLRRLSTLQGDVKTSKGEIPLTIGVVEGDPHDLGKNIIAAIYRNCGYRVLDLGRDVPKADFIRSIKNNGAKVLALSAMMSTTAAAMRDIIREARAECPQTAVMVGGAPLDVILARSYGADGYADTAVNVIEETAAAIQRAHEGKTW